MRDYPNDVLIVITCQEGDRQHEACAERLVREIMCTDNIEREEAQPLTVTQPVALIVRWESRCTGRGGDSRHDMKPQATASGRCEWRTLNSELGIYEHG
eukprot:7914441-Pyramimonas_sp.AAC.1